MLAYTGYLRRRGAYAPPGRRRAPVAQAAGFEVEVRRGQRLIHAQPGQLPHVHAGVDAFDLARPDVVGTRNIPHFYGL